MIVSLSDFSVVWVTGRAPACSNKSQKFNVQAITLEKYWSGSATVETSSGIVVIVYSIGIAPITTVMTY